MEIKQEKVLVTGASGYIALHCISELLKKGYKVKGSLRDMSKEPIIREYFDGENEKSNLEFCKLNLLHDELYSRGRRYYRNPFDFDAW